MADIVPVFILLDEASIYTFFDPVFDLVDVVLWGRVGATPHCRPLKLRFEFEVHLDHFFFARERWAQRSEHLLVFLDEIIRRGSRFRLSSFSEKSSSAWRLLFPHPCFFIHPTFSGGNSSSSHPR